MIWINIIDYRGDQTVISSSGENLFDYRTRYFVRQQQDFAKWKQFGHKFRCFTQHEDDNFDQFDHVVKIPRGNCQLSRNHVLDYYKPGTWIGLWDNDATLYWNKLQSDQLPRLWADLEQALEKEGIISMIPFNSQQTPYPKTLNHLWTFIPKLEQKGTMMFVKTHDLRYDTNMSALSDLELACRLTLAGHKLAQCQNISLNELVNGKSTIFTVNAYHEQYKKPGSLANPKGLLKWDAQIDRNQRYKQMITYIEQKLNYSIQELKRKQAGLWTKNCFDQLFTFSD